MICGRLAAACTLAALIAVNIIFLATEHLGSKPSTLSPVTSAGAGVTYARGTRLGLGGGLGAASPGLLMVQLKQLQPLGQRQLLLDGHAQQRVECLLLVLSSCQLPLHLIQLCDVLITPAGTQEARARLKDLGEPAARVIMAPVLRAPEGEQTPSAHWARDEEDVPL